MPFGHFPVSPCRVKYFVTCEVKWWFCLSAGTSICTVQDDDDDDDDEDEEEEGDDDDGQTLFGRNPS